MKNKLTKIMFILIILFLNFNMVYAAYPPPESAHDVINKYKNQEETGLSEIYNMGGAGKLWNAGGTIVGWIVFVAIIVAVIMLMIKGIQFITASPEGKAKVKNELIIWFIGLVILFSMRVVIQFIVNFALNNVNNLTI